MRHDQRRFVITSRVKSGPEVRGHLIGPGKRSVISIQRKLVIEMFGQLQRKAHGRFAWALERLTDNTAMPDPLTRQVRRKLERQSA